MLEFMILLIPISFILFIWFVVCEQPLPHISFQLKKERPDYAAYMQQVDEKIAESVAKMQKGFQEARALERSANTRLLAAWSETFERETDVRYRWEQRRDLWRIKAMEFRAAQKEIANSEIYWTLGERSFKADSLIQKLKISGDGWHLSLFLENCTRTLNSSQSILSEKRRHLSYIKDAELKSFVTNSFNYSELADYAPYYGEKPTRFDKYLAKNVDDALPALETSEKKRTVQEIIEEEMVPDRARGLTDFDDALDRALRRAVNVDEARHIMDLRSGSYNQMFSDLKAKELERRIETLNRNYR